MAHQVRHDQPLHQHHPVPRVAAVVPQRQAGTCDRRTDYVAAQPGKARGRTGRLAPDALNSRRRRLATFGRNQQQSALYFGIALQRITRPFRVFGDLFVRRRIIDSAQRLIHR